MSSVVIVNYLIKLKAAAHLWSLAGPRKPVCGQVDYRKWILTW